MTRSMFVKVYDDLEDHPRWQQLERLPECVGLWTLALSYCHRNHTDGHFPARMTDRRWGGSLEAVAELVTTGRWHAAGHDCPKCPQPTEADLYLHDYLEHQRSRAEVEELTAKRAAAGRRGGVAKASGKQSASKPLAAPGNREADTDTDTDTDTTLPAPDGAADEFDAFWAAYPRKKDKGHGRTAYKAARRKVSHEQIMDALRRDCANDFTRRAIEHVPYPASWLRSEPWDDEPLPGIAGQPAVLPPAPSGDLFGNFGGAA